MWLKYSTGGDGVSGGGRGLSVIMVVVVGVVVAVVVVWLYLWCCVWENHAATPTDHTRVA